MKKFLFLVLGLMMTASVSFAANWGDAPSAAPAAAPAAAAPVPVAAATAAPTATSTATVAAPPATTAPIAVNTPPPPAAITPSPVTTPNAVSTPGARAPKTAASTGLSNGGFIIQLDGGLVMPVSSQASTAFGSGWDALGKVGVAFDNTWSLGIKSGYSNLQYSSSSSINFNQIPVMLEAQFNVTDGPFTPFITLGAGVVFDSLAFSNGYVFPGTITSWTNFAIDPGIGFSYAFDKSIKLFVEADYILDFETTTLSSSASGEFNDNPLMLIPVNAGLIFTL
jgi:hypothetical protein